MEFVSKIKVKQVAQLEPGDLVMNKGKLEAVESLEILKEDTRIALITTKSGTYPVVASSYIVQ